VWCGLADTVVTNWSSKNIMRAAAILIENAGMQFSVEQVLFFSFTKVDQLVVHGS
jgi:hypothetical protein